MTFEEKHELIILDFLKDKTGYITLKEVEGRFINELGGGIFKVLEGLANRGFVEQISYTANPEYKFSNPEIAYAITNAGKNKYHSLKKQKRNDKLMSMVAWITFGAAIVSAAYAVIQYHFSGEKTNNQSIPKSETAPMQPIKSPPQSLTFDTTKAQNKDLSDSLTKKKGS